MDEGAIERARERLADAAAERPGAADIEAVLERARAQIEALALAAADLETTIPDRVTHAIRTGLRAEAAPMSRRVNEIRGLMNQTLKRLEHLEGDLTAERYSRVDDLGLLVDLITSGWQSVEQRLTRIEESLKSQGATVLNLDERRSSA